MLHFFRRIRQGLLIKGKTRTYFWYAFGEMLLVILGILIALQIDNWNDQQQLIRSEKVLYENIIRDLKEDQAQLAYHMEVNNSLINIFTKLYERMSGKTDSLRLDQPILLIQSFNYSSVVVDNHRNDVDQILDEQIRYWLNNYFSTTNELQIRKKEEVEEVKVTRRPFFVDEEILSLDAVFKQGSPQDIINFQMLEQKLEHKTLRKIMMTGQGSNQIIKSFTDQLLQDNRRLVALLERKLE